MTTDTPTKKNYKDTLNLPQTSFSMEAKLVQNEPGRLKKWRDAKLYEQTLAVRAGAKKWILHDGPPFANGDIHIGHVINKTLKDIIIRFRSMQGFQTPYVPGWDCHGLPIEHKIQEEIKKEGKNIREMSVLDVRRRCYEYADKYAGIQSEQFQRLGILGDWANPYLTMRPAYEAQTLEVFARIVEKGLVYRKLKPVPWSIANQTALADAELEYQDVVDNSVYVEFPVIDGRRRDGSRSFDKSTSSDRYSLIVWTTTPWTLPANLAIAVSPLVDYKLVKYSRGGVERFGVVAGELVEKVFNGRAGVESHEVVDSVNGEALLGLQYKHPFIDRTGTIVEADYVTTTDGTGLVHTAPGHGEDDYETGIREGLAVYSPVLYNGLFDDTAPDWLRGKNVFKANPEIVKHLADVGALFAEEKITHSYPHDWRSKTPIIFRATEQWFVAMDQPGADGSEPLRARAKRAVATEVEFVPAWGRARMEGMLASRPDWCISRQRAWGLPIPVFYNDKGEPLLTPESVRAVAGQFAGKGSDAWFNESPAELLGENFAYPIGFEPEKLRKEKDIFDVWFESGSSWRSVLQTRPDLHFPADLYLEGSDQHRGWFQLSLLPCLGATGHPPFRQVLTHGFIVKPDGTKVSKSDKEYVKAVDEINRHGADLLRLWCSSVDYQNDIPASPKALAEFGDKYRKIRNTLRYLLSNLYDFNPTTDSVPAPMSSLDGWALDQLRTLIADVKAAYDGYQLHRAFRLLHDFCSVQISAIYGNAMKDRLYCEIPSSPLRRRCQTVMYRMALDLTKLLAPIIVFTADEAWEQIAHKPAEDAELSSVHLAKLPEPTAVAVSAAQRDEWTLLMELRNQGTLQLDQLKKQVGLNKAGEAEIVYEVKDAGQRRALEAYGRDLEDLVGAGFHSFSADPKSDTPSVRVIDRRSDYPACARSWKRRPDVGANPAFPDLSARDAEAMGAR
ncbi:MAG TPA: isoleucine--tRNA ligase [Tepidisphaeraceae bacterium]|jgi:isoleucyl-tRNA synthetase|nr:isoleucine--tRNA ligase [Tepidisphaeraceae bacterium]